MFLLGIKLIDMILAIIGLLRENTMHLFRSSLVMLVLLTLYHWISLSFIYNRISSIVFPFGKQMVHWFMGR